MRVERGKRQMAYVSKVGLGVRGRYDMGEDVRLLWGRPVLKSSVEGVSVIDALEKSICCSLLIITCSGSEFDIVISVSPA